jgi:ABC-type multidrug transport system ATPase subunit
MICHDMELVFDTARRIIVMAHGRIIADGEPEQLFRDAEVMKQASVLPPMMIDVSLRLSEDPLNGTLFSRVSSAPDLVQALREARSMERPPSGAEAPHQHLPRERRASEWQGSLITPRERPCSTVCTPLQRSPSRSACALLPL